MKNFQKGFAMPLIIAIIALLVIGGGAIYFYTQNKSTAPNLKINEGVLPSSEKKTDISLCKDGADAKARWVCVGKIVDLQSQIDNFTSPYAKLNADKINFCKSLSGVEADFCFASIVRSQSVSRSSQKGISICNMMSNQNSWFKEDCRQD